MSRALFLPHRFPYPPDKGDKIRSYQLLRYLAQRGEVFLGTFADDLNDLRHLAKLRELCAEVFVRPLAGKARRVLSLRGFFTGEALSVVHYRDAALQRWVDRVVREHAIDQVVVFSSQMAQYVEAKRFSSMKRVVDFCDVDSDKWRQYAQDKPWLQAQIYAREASKLLAYERRIAGLFDASFFVNQQEADLFRGFAPESSTKVHHFDNGVDTEYFDPAEPHPSPFGQGGQVAVFTGAMDYWPNVDAVCWFASEVLPLIQERVPDLRFFIVGSSPTAEVRALAAISGVTVTGRVPDVRPFLAHAAVAVAPLRVARGTQNKVLEALAMARPVVGTPDAAAGLGDDVRLTLSVAGSRDEFAAAVVKVLGDVSNSAGRRAVEASHSWASNLRVLDAYIEG